MGFTIVELLIVIVVIAILSAVTIVTYGNIQKRSANTRVIADITNSNKLLQVYSLQNGGVYPTPDDGSGYDTVYVDSNCSVVPSDYAHKRTDWIPGVQGLPQNPGLDNTGVMNAGGCYVYASNGSTYIISAWNGKSGGPDTDTLYRRVGFREEDNMRQGRVGNAMWVCPSAGWRMTGFWNGVYHLDGDYYKHSYTISNISTESDPSCSETPPPGA